MQEHWALGGKTSQQENKSTLNMDDENSVLYKEHSEDQVSSPGQNEEMSENAEEVEVLTLKKKLALKKNIVMNTMNLQ